MTFGVRATSTRGAGDGSRFARPEAEREQYVTCLRRSRAVEGDQQDFIDTRCVTEDPPRPRTASNDRDGGRRLESTMRRLLSPINSIRGEPLLHMPGHSVQYCGPGRAAVEDVHSLDWGDSVATESSMNPLGPPTTTSGNATRCVITGVPVNIASVMNEPRGPAVD
jgi:hypothetical protein